MVFVLVGINVERSVQHNLELRLKICQSWFLDYALKAISDEKTSAQKLYCMDTSQLTYKIEGNIKKPFKLENKSANGCCPNYQFSHSLANI